jgi:Transposase DDE domain group 1
MAMNTCAGREETSSPALAPDFRDPASIRFAIFLAPTPRTNGAQCYVSPFHREVPEPQERHTQEGECQPTVSRWENTPTLREIVKLSGVLMDLYYASYAAPPQAVTLDIDDTCDVAHGPATVAVQCAL